MKESRILAITGMHRSGTSAVASVLQRAGVRIGTRLMEGDAGNPRGYFEDEEFVSFHDEQLARSGQRVLAQAGVELKPLRRQDVRWAGKLIRRRRELGLWGWKDPRASLYLDFWARQLPRARFLLVFRDPLEVVLSLLRRGSEHEFEVIADPLAGLRSWTFHNQSIVDFYQRHPERCFLVNVHHVFADVGGFVEAAAMKLDLPLRTESIAGVLHREELHRRPDSRPVAAILRRIDPRVADLSVRLEEAADWTAGDNRSPACDPAVADSLRQLRKMYDSSADPGAVSRQIFSLLLAFLDGEAVPSGSPSAQVLDLLDRLASFRRHAENLTAEIGRRAGLVADLSRHAGHLEILVPELEAHGQGLEARLAELSEHAANLEDKTRELEAHSRQLEDSRAATLEQLHALESHAEKLESRSRQERFRVDELSRHCEGLEKLAAERADQTADLAAHAGNLEALLARAREHSQELEAHAGELERLLDQRSEHLQSLEAHAGNLERLRSQDRLQLGELEKHSDNLESRRRRDEDRLAALGAHVDNLEAARLRDRLRVGALERQVGDRDRRLQDLEARRTELDQRLARQAAAVASLEGEARRLGGELEEALDDLHQLASGWWPRLLRRVQP